jgi:hypothetical protein
VRGSDTYRWQLAANLQLKFFYEHASPNNLASINGHPGGNGLAGGRHV